MEGKDTYLIVRMNKNLADWRRKFFRKSSYNMSRFIKDLKKKRIEHKGLNRSRGCFLGRNISVFFRIQN